MNNTTLNHLDVVRGIYGSFAAGDLEAWRTYFADDVVLDVPGDHPTSGRWEGIDGVLAFFAAGREATEELQVLDLLAGERHAAALVHVRATKPGRQPLENRTLHLFELNGDGRVAAVRFHNDDQAAVDAFWS